MMKWLAQNMILLFYCLLFLGQTRACNRTPLLHEDPEAKQAADSKDDDSDDKSSLSFYFISERLGKSKLVSESWRRSIKLFLDHTSCFNEGKASEYEGGQILTASGRSCAPWSVAVELLELQMRRFEEEKVRMWSDADAGDVERRSKIAEVFNKYTDMANNTIAHLRNQGLLHHNMCRDPDETGVPWCYVLDDVDGHSTMTWEPCDVPTCTVCWDIRRRALKHEGYDDEGKFWKAECNMVDGSFSSLQCKQKWCWCSERNGTMIEGTLKDINQHGIPVCKSRLYSGEDGEGDGDGKTMGDNMETIRNMIKRELLLYQMNLFNTLDKDSSNQDVQ